MSKEDRVRLIKIHESDLELLINTLAAESGDVNYSVLCDLLHQEVVYVSDEVEIEWDENKAGLHKERDD